jgi:hypothetical protein
MENSFQCKDFTCQKLYACILTETIFLEANEPGDLHLNRPQTSLPLIASETYIYRKKDSLLDTILASSEASNVYLI